MFCPNCGAENKETTVPCHQCGFKLSGVAQSKFKGTIMLNSDESVQKLVEAEKARRAAAGLAEPPPPEGAAGGAEPPAPSAADPVAPGGASALGANVPRPRRKMAGTILGVAPPTGGSKGVVPAVPEAPQRSAHSPSPVVAPVAASPGAATATVASPAARATSLAATSLGYAAPPMPPGPAAPVSAADPDARTQAMQGFTTGHNLSGTMLGGTQAVPAVRQAPAPAAVGGTQPLVQSEAFAATAASLPAQPAPEPAASQTGPLPQASTGTVPLPQTAEKQGTVPLRQVPEAAPPEGLPEADAASPGASPTQPPLSRAAVPPGLSAGEVFLVIVSCGLYGVVRMLRQRKKG